MATVNNPCKDCTGRYPGCHDHCPARQSWVQEHERVRKAEREYRELWGYTAREIAKNRRKNESISSL